MGLGLGLGSGSGVRVRVRVRASVGVRVRVRVRVGSLLGAPAAAAGVKSVALCTWLVLRVRVRVSG